jgi:hypothetical protein
MTVDSKGGNGPRDGGEGGPRVTHAGLTVGYDVRSP